jgi:hypothetical protein
MTQAAYPQQAAVLPGRRLWPFPASYAVHVAAGDQ